MLARALMYAHNSLFNVSPNAMNFPVLVYNLS